MTMSRIAAILTCFNRKSKTLACLDALYQQQMLNEIQLDVYLVDDGSTDGTATAIQQTYPEVKVIPGTGGLFWNGGMYLGFGKAITVGYDYYLWLNDDTLLYPHALKTLLETAEELAQQGERQAIITGSTCNPETGELTYGGVVHKSWWHPLKFKCISPTDTPQRCDTMYGNCVLIPQTVVYQLGNLESEFTHYAGDFDYGLRAYQQDCSVWVAPGYLATCHHNPPEESIWLSQKMSLKERFKKVFQPKGLPPKEAMIFARRHAGILWFFYWVLPYIRLFFVSTFKSNKKLEVSS
ncbi:MAG: glycosyltransferase family 2 protein [Microcoleaceae cyanobacterium]